MRNIGAEMEGKYKRLFWMAVFLLKRHVAAAFLAAIFLMPTIITLSLGPSSLSEALILFRKFLAISVTYLISFLAFCYGLPRVYGTRYSFRFSSAIIFAVSQYLIYSVMQLVAIYIGYAIYQFRMVLEAIAIGFAGWEGFLVLYVLTTNGWGRSTLEGLMVSYSIVAVDFLVFPEVKVFIAPIEVVLSIVFATVVSLAGITALTLRIGAAFTEFDTLYGLRGFFFTIFADDPSMLEDAFERSAVERRLPVGLAKVKGKEGELAILVPYIHPGPFREVGSSNMPFVVYEALREDGIDAITLHGTCSHGENLVSRREMSRLIGILRGKLNKLGASGAVSKVIRVKEGDLTFTAQRFGSHRRGGGGEGDGVCGGTGD